MWTGQEWSRRVSEGQKGELAQTLTSKPPRMVRIRIRDGSGLGMVGLGLARVEWKRKFPEC